MNEEGISLGWNCESAGKGVELGIRKRKENGYLTCPFDECLSNYDGLILCLKEDFKYFYDLSYLKVIPAEFSAGATVKGDNIIINTRYKFIFNHESPDHVNLYLTQNWAGGKNHFVDNNFALFIKRYSKRIDNFRKYVNDPNNKITFLIGKFNPDINELSETLKEYYPNLNCNIFWYRPSVETKLFDDIHNLMLLER